MSRIYTNKEAKLGFNSQILTFNGEILTFWVKGLTHYDIEGFSYTEEDMGGASITFDMMVAADIDPAFGLDWYVDFRGERFYNKSLKPPCVKDTKSLKYKYSMTFLSQRADLERYEFANFVTALTDPQPISYDFTLPLSITDFVERFNINLDYYFGAGNWVMSLDAGYMDNLNTLIYDGISPVTVAFSRVTLWALLTQLYDTYGLRWRIAPSTGGMTITIGATPDQLSHVFEYGSGNGLVSVERINPDAAIFTRLSGKGSSRNVPFRYFDSSTSDFSEDPDNNEYTRLIPYPNLMPTCYRDYVQGWNAGTPDPSLSYAYNKGADDVSAGSPFNPVDFAISATEIIWGIRKGSIENAEDIYPTIQDVSLAGLGRIDEVLAVEAVINDNYDTSVAVALADDLGFQSWLPLHGSEFLSNSTDGFTLSDPMNEVKFSLAQNFRPKENGGYAGTFNADISISLMDGATVVDSIFYQRVAATEVVWTQSGATFTDIPAGTYSLKVDVSIYNNLTGSPATFTTILSDIQSVGASVFKPTFDVWIKNIWDSSKGAETDDAYMHRIWDPLLPAATDGDLTILFSDGNLAGEDYEFLVAKYDGTSNFLIEHNEDVSTGGHRSHWKLTLIKSDANLESTKLYLPNMTVNASTGDHFFFTNIELPWTYVYAAEDRVQAYIENELAKVSDEFPTYAIDPSPIFLADFAEVDDIKVGNVINLLNARLIGESAYPFFINTLTIEYSKGKLLPKWSVLISEKPTSKSTTISLIQGDIKVLSSSIKSAEETVAMVDSLLQQKYLKRDGTDQYSLSPTTFAKKVTTEDGLKSADYLQAQIGGAGYAVAKDANGNWVLEIDKVRVRQSLDVNELVINQVSIYGGKHLYSAAAMTVSAVDDFGDAYRCHLDLKQGTVVNHFVVGDLAYCQRRDPLSDSVIKYYWRAVTVVGPDFIELDNVSDYDGTGIPAVGDNIAQLGNHTDVNRQAAYIIDQLSGGQCTQYAGISTFSLTGKDQVSSGFDPSTGRAFQRIYGDMYVGQRDESHYLKFDSDLGVISYRGVLTQDSTVVDSSGNSSNITVDRGPYASDVQYFVGNTVTYLGSTYYCDVNSTGNLPTDGSFWHVWAAKGTDGTNGTSVRIIHTTDTMSVWPISWDPSTAYNENDLAIYNNKMYLANSNNSNVVPTNETYWAFIMDILAGDGWLLESTGHLWIWDGTTWGDAGQIKGDPGNDGKGIASITLYYLATDASIGVDASTAGWTNTVQATTVYNKYLWTYQKIVYTDSTVWNSLPCITGAFGASAYEPRVSQPFISLLADADGALIAGELTKAFFTMSVYRDGAPLQQQNEWDIRSMSDSSSGFTYSLYGDTITIESIEPTLGSGYIDVILFDTNTDLDFASLRISFAKSKQGIIGADGSIGLTGADGVAIICDKQSLSVTPDGNDFTAAITVRLAKGSSYVPKSAWTSVSKTLTDVSAGADSSTSDSYMVNLTGFSASTTQLGYVLVTIVYLGTTFTISISVSRIFNPVQVAKGLWATATEYTGNCIQRDVVKDPTNLNYYALRPNVGLLTSETQPHLDLTRWELLNSFKNVATETLLAENANIAGFIYKNQQMVSQSGTINGVDSSTFSDPDFVPNVTIDGILGLITVFSGIAGGLSIGKNSLFSDNMFFGEELIEPIASLVPTYNASIGAQASWAGTGDPSIHIYTQAVTLPEKSSIRFVLFAEATAGASSYVNTIQIKDALLNVVYELVSTKIDEYEAVITKLDAGEYTIHAYCVATGGDAYVNLFGYESEAVISASASVARTKVGLDGFYSYWGDKTYFYYKASYGIEFIVKNFGLRILLNSGFEKYTGGAWTAWIP